MSDLAQSALPDAAFDGLVSVREAGLCGMVTLKADLASAALGKALLSVTGAELPTPRRIAVGSTMQVAWMAPDELLILCDHSAANRVVADISAAMPGEAHLAVNVSDARAMFEVTGAPGSLRDVLAKLTPADLSPDALAPGEMRRTRFAQVPAALWFVEARTARIVCFRSVARYMFDLLSIAAGPGGEVNFH